MGGNFISPLVAVSRGGRRVDVFAKGVDDAIYHLSYNGSFGWDSAWENLGGGFASEPAAVSWGPNRLDVFAVGPAGTLWQKYFDGTSWSGWVSLGGSFVSPPTVCSKGVGYLDVFGIGAANVPYHEAYSPGAWTDWETLGGSVSTAAACVTSQFFGKYRFDVFTVAGDALYQESWDGTAYDPGTTNRNYRSGSFASEPVVVSRADNRLDVFGVKYDGGMAHQAWNGKGWAPGINAFDNLGGSFITFA